MHVHADAFGAQCAEEASPIGIQPVQLQPNHVQVVRVLAAFAALAFLPALAPPQAQALDWQDLWLRADQQAAAAFKRGKPSDIAQLLGKVDRDSPWHAMLLYRGGNFAEAAAQFAASDTAVAHYNRGNAHALDGDLEAAIAAYDAALARNPAMRDAHFNRALVRRALAESLDQPADGSERKSKRAPKDSPSASRPRGPAGSGRLESGDPSQRGAARDERSAPVQKPAQNERGQEKAEEQSQPRDGLGAEERERLEGLLSRVPDDPGSLLANRFAEQLRSRGTPHRDSGGRW